jgi:hypothetical protein
MWLAATALILLAILPLRLNGFLKEQTGRSYHAKLLIPKEVACKYRKSGRPDLPGLSMTDNAVVFQ